MRGLPVTGAGLTVTAPNREYSLLASADPVSERLEELQIVLGEGPCVEALTAHHPVLVPDLDADGAHRWPAYAASARELGIRAIFSFPLQVGAAQLGALDLFRARPGPLNGPELGRAFDLAHEAVQILLSGPDHGAATAGEALEVSSELFQAQGMVMVQIGGTLEEAMARIRAYAYAHDLRLLDVARAVVAREVWFDGDQR